MTWRLELTAVYAVALAPALQIGYSRRRLSDAQGSRLNNGFAKPAARNLSAEWIMPVS